MVTSFISTLNINTGVAQLSAWLTSQAIHVPPGWIDACVAWLAEEHGGIDACNHLTKSDWCQLIYEQWLHSDLKQLECPVLPSTISTSRNPHDNSLSSGTDANTMNSPALKLDGELCLQVVNLFNIGESYYGQLRRHEGNLSVNLPSLEVDGENNLDGHTTQMTQAFSQYLNQSPTQTNNFRQSTMANCLTLFLTDGVNEIKVIEFGTQSTRSRSSLPFKELSKKLRPGVKIRLRGPLLLRNNVLLVPPGALQSLSSHQLEVLGGEVTNIYVYGFSFLRGCHLVNSIFT
ncbi:RecQ-mediated genome instability protein 1 [Schistosoma bovis]|uniref:RecQ-mediated genome instability protein 1 n=1 Tax=Schistosoma bovis TaxID=6184 RepID=A0A430Q4G4_SCHBO|nr:RecQ-mediated genome instability protein 1 [Schistosoma bovis]RTG82590.1 RecQ-mediated genome instability protein 1 [Schistosoma bovis]